MKAFALYTAATIGIVALLGWLLTLGFSGPRDASAIGLSAAVVIVVQLAAFGVTRMLAPKGVIAAWGAGALLRFLTLVIYALLVVKVLGMPAAAALLSMAVFFFLSTLIEPLLLKL